MPENKYEILEIAVSASQSEIEAAFRRLLARNHPDHNPDDPKAIMRMKRINEAHDTLGDPELRRKYDRSLDETADRPEYARPPTPPPQPQPVQVFVEELTQAHILELKRRRQETALPGDVYLWNGVPLVSLLLLIFMFLAVQPALSSAERNFRTMLGAVGLCGAIGCVVGGIALVVTRNRVNHNYLRRRKSINLCYQLPSGLSSAFGRLTTSLRALQYVQLWQGNRTGPHAVAQGNNALVRELSPQWVCLNLPVLCLAFGDSKSFFLPEGVLIERGREIDFLRYGDFKVVPCNASVYRGERIVGYRWRYPRVDGGPDRRYRGNYQIPIKEPVYVTMPALTIKMAMGGTEVVFLGERAEPLDEFANAVQQWQSALSS